uniref:Glutamate/phenylalanine/leucine/valine/L-tryptophan dehydrogenase C-terminal domain-containing protein n=2 Tax=Pseudo-nitzschia australis TaxID=44445 RepID=A0A7S4ARS2_9STRA|mmetsp:Transcript_3088/g.6666  ORF Transcript_3088/g.6666 Transcript_3088/m.6666 type:complete len:832 (-) Transcript_3088:423-2918(-)
MVSFRTAVRSAVFSGLVFSSTVFSLSTISPRQPSQPIVIPDITNAVKEFFSVVGSTRDAKVFEAPVRQEGIKLYIATDGDFDHGRPGNGGIRLLDYQSDGHAIDDAIRLAEGMTRKHDMFRTGFSGAKLVANTNIALDRVKRKQLMEDIAQALEVLAGSVYTGCDLNTCDIDMDYLTEATKEQYVLAGRDSAVDTNVATAASVIGSILGLIESHKDEDGGLAISDLTFTVQGCGKVGSTVAKELVRLGAKKVQTCDIRESTADIEGCTPIKDWANTPTDFLVPCANSLAITEDIATNFPEGIRFCTGATNSPFAEEAKEIFAERGVFHVPESISSAGAILADSVEWYDLDLYQTVEPTLMYGWIRNLSQNKARTMVELAEKVSKRMAGVVPEVVPPRKGDPIGKSFPEWIEQNTKKTETLIVGGGMAGCSTAFALGEKNVKSILVERGSSLAPPTASSNGDSRMYRKMYSDEFFSKMQATALQRWNDVEEKSGETLLQKNGLLFYGEDTGETVEGSVLGAKKTMENLNLEHTFFETGDSIADEYPALKGCKGMPYSGVYEADAGHIKASKACNAMANIAKEVCDIHLDTKIVSLDVKDEKVTATTVDGLTIKADNVVIAAGPWTNSVLESAGLPKLNVKVWEIQWGHYRVKKSVASSIPQAFHFRKGQCEVDGGLYYVFPASATESPKSSKDVDNDDEYTYVKVGVDFPSGGDMEGMDTFNYAGSEKVLELMDGWVAEHLPDVEERVESYTHPYTMTEDSYFVMDKVADKVAVFSGGSGRAFKFGPLIGDCMAALVTGNQPPLDLERFSASRDGVTTGKVASDKEPELALA